MNKKWIMTAFIMVAMLFVLAACGKGEKTESGSTTDKEKFSSQTESGKKYKIGVTQIVEHPSLNSAHEGFQKAIEDSGLNVEYEMQNAQNDNSNNVTIEKNLVNSGVDLIFANSTPSAQAVAGVTSDIPIIFTSVTDAVGAELVQSMESPGGNVTGTIDNHPETIPATMKFLKEQLGAKNVGMVYNSGEPNSCSQVDAVKEILKDMDMKVVEVSVATSADVKLATESLLGKVDAMYIITDNTVVSALESVISVAIENKIPVMVGEFDSVKRGGLAAYGFEYYDIGYEAGEMAVKVLKNVDSLFSKFQQFWNTLGIDRLINNFLASIGVNYLPSTWGSLILMLLVTVLIKFYVDWFLKTEIGLAIRATGDNKRMIRSFSANTDTLVIIGLGFSNALVALSGALIAQYSNVFVEKTYE